MKTQKIIMIMAILLVLFMTVRLAHASDYEKAVSYWEFDDLSYDDDFGDGSIDYNRWSDYFTSPMIESGQLRSVSSPQDISAGLKNNTANVLKLSGNFDVQVDFDTSDQMKPSQGFAAAELRIQGTTYAYGVQKHYYSSGSQAYASWTNEDGGRGWGSVATTQTSGKFRLARNDTGLHGYSWTGSAWSEFATDTTPDTSNMYVSILGTYGFSGCDVDATATFDNFTVVNGEQVVDLNGANTGAITGATQTSGQHGNALNFDGDDHVYVADSSGLDFGTGDFAISSWINSNGYVDQGSVYNVVLGKLTSNTDWSNGYAIVIRDNNKVGVRLNNTEVIYSTNIVNDGWHYVAVSRDSGVLSMYVDGILQGSISSITTMTNAADILFGRDPGSTRYFNGLIDDVGIWDRALDAYEIDSIYDVGIEAYENLALGADDLTLGYTTEELATLAQLYADGKAGLDPESLVVGDKSWTYLSGDLPGDIGGITYNIGDSWIYDGKYYIKLGSGLEGGAVPELPPFAAQGMVMVFGSVSIWVKKRRVKVSQNQSVRE